MWEPRFGEEHSDRVGNRLAGLSPPQGLAAAGTGDSTWKAGCRAVEGV